MAEISKGLHRDDEVTEGVFLNAETCEEEIFHYQGGGSVRSIRGPAVRVTYQPSEGSKKERVFPGPIDQLLFGLMRGAKIFYTCRRTAVKIGGPDDWMCREEHQITVWSGALTGCTTKAEKSYGIDVPAF